MSLLEVLAATAVLLTTCAAVTTVVVTAARATGRAGRVTVADQALLAEAARLRALPFFVAPAAGGAGDAQDAAPSAVAELFPHADVGRNVDKACYVASGAGAGSFESVVTLDGVEVRRTAWMALSGASGWRLVASTALEGWDARGGVPVPAEALLVRLQAPASAEGAKAEASGSLKGAIRVLTIVLSPEGGVPGVELEVEATNRAASPSRRSS